MYEEETRNILEAIIITHSLIITMLMRERE